jgi:hypothetical protein
MSAATPPARSVMMSGRLSTKIKASLAVCFAGLDVVNRSFSLCLSCVRWNNASMFQKACIFHFCLLATLPLLTTAWNETDLNCFAPCARSRPRRSLQTRRACTVHSTQHSGPLADVWTSGQMAHSQKNSGTILPRSSLSVLPSELLAAIEPALGQKRLRVVCRFTEPKPSSRFKRKDASRALCAGTAALNT